MWWKVAMGAVALGAFAAFGVCAHRSRQRWRTRPDAVRLSKLLAVFGWVLLLAGLLVFSSGLPSGYQERVGGMLITGASMISLGFCFVMAYHNFRLEVGELSVRFRTMVGFEREIRYDQITTYRVGSRFDSTRLTIKAADGTRLSVDALAFDASPILRAIEFYEDHGYWPTSGSYWLYPNPRLEF